MTRSLCAHCQRCALSTPAQQWERQHHVGNTVGPQPPLHRGGSDLLRSRLVASQDSGTRPVARTRRWTRSTGAAGSTESRAGGARASPTNSSAVVNSFRLGHCRTFFVISGGCSRVLPRRASVRLWRRLPHGRGLALGSRCRVVRLRFVRRGDRIPRVRGCRGRSSGCAVHWLRG